MKHRNNKSHRHFPSLALLVFFSCWLELCSAADEWQLLWSDEFDSGVLDSALWTPEVGLLGYNAEFQTYTDRPENVMVRDGKLHISAIRDLNADVGYTSGRINSMNKVQIKYATVEASIKVPDMRLGLWPAFWTLGQDFAQVGWPAAGEIDIMELGQKQGSSIGLGNRRVLTAIHWDAMGAYLPEFAVLDMSEDLSQAFHTYKMEWQPDYVSMFVDGNLVHRFDISLETCLDCPELHQHHFLVLNVAVAGHFTCCEFGFDLNAFPEGTAWTMEVDYVRVYGNQFTEIILADGVSTRSPEAGVVDATTEPQMPTNAPTGLAVVVTGLPQTSSTITSSPWLPSTMTPTASPTMAATNYDADPAMTSQPTSFFTAQMTSVETSQDTDPTIPIPLVETVRASVDPSIPTTESKTESSASTSTKPSTAVVDEVSNNEESPSLLTTTSSCVSPFHVPLYLQRFVMAGAACFLMFYLD